MISAGCLSSSVNLSVILTLPEVGLRDQTGGLHMVERDILPFSLAKLCGSLQIVCHRTMCMYPYIDDIFQAQLSEIQTLGTMDITASSDSWGL